MWKKILIIVFALIVVFSLSGVFSAFAFLGPPGPPPANNNILQVTSSRAFVIATTTVISTQPQLIFRSLGNPGDIILFPSVGNDGKVGIGTTAPDERLHVSGNLKISGDSTITGTLSATNLIASGTLAGILNAGYLSAGVFGYPGNKGNYTFQASGSTNPILFIDATNERVGVGTSSAAYTLDVLGQAYLRGTSTVAGATGLFVNSFGRVGIGTTTQSSPLHVWSDISGIIQSLDSTASVSYLQFHNSSTGYNSSSDGLTVGVNGSDAYVYNREAGSLYLGTNDTSRINIDSNGRVGIGGNSTSPYRLYVASGPVLFRNTLLDPTFYVNDGTTVKIGIATTTPSYALDVVGTAQFSQPIIVGTPTIDSHATTKSYVDSILTGGTATGTLANLTVTGTTTLATTAGNVGIGYTTPGSVLPTTFTSANSKIIEARSVSTGDVGLFLRRGSDDAAGLDMWSDNSSGDSYIDNRHNADTSDIRFRTKTAATAVNAMIITGAGYVGIGTTTPASLFTVASSTGSANFFQVNSVGNIIAGSGGLSQWQSSSTAFTFNTPVNLGNIVTASDLGSHTLYNQPVTSALAVGTNVGPTFSIDSNPVLTIYGESDGNGGAQNLRIGINDTTPSYTLDVVGTAQFSQPIIVGTPTIAGHATTKSYVDSVLTGGTATGTLANLTVTGTTTLATAGGNVGIGTTTPSKKLDIVGKTRIQGTGFTASALDYDLNIVGNTNSTSTYPHLMVANRNQSGNSLAKIGFNAGDGAIIAAFVADLAGYGTGQDYTASGLDSPGAGIQVYGNYPFMIKTNNVERLRVTNDGSVGIGTSSPVGKLEVIDTAAGGLRGIVSTQISASNHGAYFSFRKSRGSVGSPATVVSGDDIGSINGWAYDGTNFLNTAAVLFDTSGAISADSVPTRIAFYAGTNSGNLSEKMTITSDGYVGIGTTTPSYALDVVGTAQFSQPIIVGTPTIAGHATTKSYVDSVLTGGTATGTLANLTVTGTTTLATTAGRVGIGTTTPSQKLEVVAGDIKINGLGTSGGRSLIIKRDGATSEWKLIQGHSETNSLEFLENSSSVFMIKTGGSVGIGTTTPASKFVVAGSKVNFQVLDTGSLSLLGADEGAGAATDFIIRTGANNTNSPNIILQKGRSNAGMAIGSGDNMGSIKFYGGTGSAFAEGARIRGDAEGTFTTSSLPSALTFWTAPSGSNAVVERMRITNAGSVGIGTTTPQSDLHIYDQSSSVILSLDANGTGGDDYRFVSSVDASSIGGGKLGIFHGDSGVYRMVINDSGYVGIATTTPSYTLDVVGTAQFSQPIIVGTPTLASHATTKSYVDSAFTGGTATGTLASLVVTGTTTLQGTTVLTGLSGVLKTSAGVISGSATTDDLTEGAINKYFSNTQARNALSGTSPINYSQTTGVIALNTVPVSSGGTGTTTLTGMLKGNGVNAFSGVTGTANYLTKWSDANTISTSTLYESGGNVGIGTTSLPFRLSVLGDTTIRFGVHTTDYIGVNGSAFGIRMGTSTGNTYSELLALSAGGSAWNNLILQSGGGSVGIGTTTPSNNFQVAGTVKLTSGGGDFSIDDSGNFVIQL